MLLAVSLSVNAWLYSLLTVSPRLENSAHREVVRAVPPPVSASRVAEKALPAPPLSPVAALENARLIRGPMQSEDIKAFWTPGKIATFRAQKLFEINLRYAGLFRLLGVSPETISKVQDAMVAKAMLPLDIMKELDAQGGGSLKEFQDVRAQQTAELETSIASLLGDKADVFKNYMATVAERETLTPFFERLSYGSKPLTAAQSEQLVSVLKANGGAKALGSPEFQTAAAAVLTPEQLTEFNNFASLRAASLVPLGQIVDQRTGLPRRVPLPPPKNVPTTVSSR